MKNLAVVLHTCDAYERLWEGWAYCWNKFQSNTELSDSPLYFMNEIKIPSLDLKYAYRPTGKGEWSDRLIRGLVNVPEPYVLYMQEDFWLKDTLNDSKLNMMMEYARQGEAVRIMGSGKKLVDTLHPYEEPYILRRFQIDSPYFFGHAATIWYKPHLMACLGPGEDPWRNCYEGNERCKRMRHEPVHYHYPFEWYHEVHNNVKRTSKWKDANGDRSLPGEISQYGLDIIKEMQG